MMLKGRCLCGKVRYQINKPLIAADHCHCSMCRRQHGAAFATYAQCTADSFEWVAGEALVKTYYSGADLAAGWSFCTECGSTLAAASQDKVTSITLGTLEGEVDITPSSHIFVDSKASWYKICDNLVQFSKRESDE